MADPIMVNVYEPDRQGVERLVYREANAAELADFQALAAAAQQAQEETVAAAWVELRMIRDRWLAQTDYIDLHAANPTGFILPAAIGTALTTNAAAWQTWRQALRDLPANVTDPQTAVQAVAATHATSNTFSAPWPQPPTSPVIHLT